ncbi:hypothetical protein QCA50_006419 [Cerrena zonata]|uniref:Uncharacterized protein n=1 Tax=Cerrena zonata TaxID=2478898 RepID=A0AAW0GF63_9APHY
MHCIGGLVPVGARSQSESAIPFHRTAGIEFYPHLAIGAPSSDLPAVHACALARAANANASHQSSTSNGSSCDGLHRDCQRAATRAFPSQAGGADASQISKCVWPDHPDSIRSIAGHRLHAKAFLSFGFQTPSRPDLQQWT